MTTTPTTNHGPTGQCPQHGSAMCTHPDPAIVPFDITYDHPGPFNRGSGRYIATDDHMDVATFSGIGVTYDVVLIADGWTGEIERAASYIVNGR